MLYFQGKFCWCVTKGWLSQIVVENSSEFSSKFTPISSKFKRDFLSEKEELLVLRLPYAVHSHWSCITRKKPLNIEKVSGCVTLRYQWRSSGLHMSVLRCSATGQQHTHIHRSRGIMAKYRGVMAWERFLHDWPFVWGIYRSAVTAMRKFGDFFLDNLHKLLKKTQ